MSNMAEQIARITRELRELQEELLRASRDNPAAADRIVDELLDRSMAEEFKAALDQMRKALWAYLETAGELPANGADYSLQKQRLQRVNAMLKKLTEAQADAAPASSSFFDRVSDVVAEHLDKKAG